MLRRVLLWMPANTARTHRVKHLRPSLGRVLGQPVGQINHRLRHLGVRRRNRARHQVRLERLVRQRALHAAPNRQLETPRRRALRQAIRRRAALAAVAQVDNQPRPNVLVQVGHVARREAAQRVRAKEHARAHAVLGVGGRNAAEIAKVVRARERHGRAFGRRVEARDAVAARPREGQRDERETYNGKEDEGRRPEHDKQRNGRANGGQDDGACVNSHAETIEEGTVENERSCH
jgi:hypothetical protein